MKTDQHKTSHTCTRHLHHSIVLVVMLFCLSPPLTAHAQSPQETDEHGIVKPQPGPGFDEIPDIYGYISLTIPQCGGCGDVGVTLTYEEAEFPQHDIFYWIDPRNIASIFGEIISWLVASIHNLFIWLFCFLLQIFQHLANWITLSVNAIIWIMNFVWRIIAYWIKTLEHWFYVAWYLMERIRLMANGMQSIFSLIWHYIKVMVEMFLTAIQVTVAILSLIVQAIVRLIGIIAYFLGFLVDFIFSFGTAMRGETIPTEIEQTGHPFYSFMRGVLDALFDSEIAWIAELVLGLANVATIIGVIKHVRTDSR